jgi:flavin-binding protein dodecin
MSRVIATRHPSKWQVTPATLNLKEAEMKEKDSVYRIIEMVGTSSKSWEEAAKNAVELASKTVKDTRVAEIKDLDMKIENGKVVLYRATVRLSFKYIAD